MQTATQVKATSSPTQTTVGKARQPANAAPVNQRVAPVNDEQPENATRLGHSLGAISVLPPDPPVQRKRNPGMVSRLTAFNASNPGNATAITKFPASWTVRPPIQAKPTVGQPNDQYEQGAGRVADQVMRMAEPRVQAKCACGGDAGPDGECATCKAKRLEAQAQVQTKADEEVIQTKVDTGAKAQTTSGRVLLGQGKSAFNVLSMQMVQRSGGWADADTKPGNGIATGEPQTGWNAQEHAVGNIRRIPLDGLTGGLQHNPEESTSARKLTREKVTGPVKDAARSDAHEQKGRGRAIALVPSRLNTNLPVDVFFHLHGNTENKSRGFGGWRQHKQSAEVRDVARDRIAQQIEAAKSPQIVGILPQGVNKAVFGQISPDAYIRDAFDRLTEVGAWKKAPPSFRVVLSAHSGGSFTVERMIKGEKGYQLPANLKTLILFEALNANLKDPDPKRRFEQVDTFGAWIERMLAAHIAYLNDPAVSAADKQAHLEAATQIRLYWDPNGSYNKSYLRLSERIDNWFTRHKARLGANYQVLRNLVVFIPKSGVKHEGIVRAGITESLTASSTSGATPSPAPTVAPTSVPAGTKDVTPAPPAGSAPVPATPAASAPTPVKPAKAATGVKALTADEKKRALEGALKQAQTAGKKADRDAITNTLLYNNTDAESWWAGMVFDASFLDVPIQPSGGSVTGVHRELYDRLVIAEKKLMARFPNLSKAQIAGKMGIYQIAGVRPPKKATGGSLPSYHCFGLAIDINHPTNPFVGNLKPTLDADHNKKVTAEEQAKYDLSMQSRSPRIIERAMLLLHDEQFNIEKRIKVPKGAGTTAGRLWEIHHHASEALAEYLRLADELDGQKLKNLVDARRKAGDNRDLAFWKQQIAADKAHIKSWDFMHHKAPEKSGYMDLGKELVEALVGNGKLLWGGSYGGAKDMMHFDWRDGTISKRPPKGWKPPAK